MRCWEVTATRDASGLAYAHTDLLGTPIATLLLDSAAVTGVQLRAPYGQPRNAASTTSGTACLRGIRRYCL